MRTIGNVATFDVDTGKGEIEAEGKKYKFSHQDIMSMTVGPSSFRMVNAGEKVEFTPTGDTAKEVKRI